jgi:hypothetical protein
VCNVELRGVGDFTWGILLGVCNVVYLGDFTWGILLGVCHVELRGVAKG